MDLRAPIVEFLESLCQSLDVEEEEEPAPFSDMLNLDSVPNEPSPLGKLESFCQPSSIFSMFNRETLDELKVDTLNLDSHQIERLDHPVWDMDANVWLDDLIAELDESSSLETMENNVDFSVFVEGINPEDWEHVWNDVVDHFDVHLLS